MFVPISMIVATGLLLTILITMITATYVKIVLPAFRAFDVKLSDILVDSFRYLKGRIHGK